MAKGLGRGLGALLSSSPPAESIAPVISDKGPMTLRVSLIQPNPNQPRRSFDEESLAALAESIKEHGLIQPIAVRKDGEKYRIIAGERRWRACRMAGLKEIPAVVLEADELKTLELALVENLQREDLNPIEEAESFQTLISRFGLTQEDAGRRVGRSRPAVANALRLLTLPEDLQKLVRDGQLSAGHARALLAIADEDQRAEVARLIIENDLSVREAEAIAADIRARAEAETVETPEAEPVKPAPAAIREDYFASWRSSLSDKFGRKVDFKPGRKKGYITLEYYDNDDLEALVELLSGLAGKESTDE
ncbi:MAG: ParB/RepB/Spo0J family partition protein [Clostridia bacterium]|nr:ParB/RepB/Spo0J family partition protein [Clostridia bacterium]